MLAIDPVQFFIKLGTTELGIVQKNKEVSKIVVRCACCNPLLKVSFKMGAQIQIKDGRFQILPQMV